HVHAYTGTEQMEIDSVIGFSDYSVDGRPLKDDEFAPLSMFDRAQQLGFDLIQKSSPCHHSKLYPHQLAAVRAVLQYQKDPVVFEATKKKSSGKKKAVVLRTEEDSDSTDDDDEKAKKPNASSRTSKSKAVSVKEVSTVTKLDYALPHQRHTRHINANMRITPAGGKTWILEHIAIRCGHRVLLVTNSKENANQALVDVLKNTSIAAFADVLLIRPMESGKDDAGNEDKYVDADFDAKYTNHIMSCKPNSNWTMFTKYKQLLDRGGLVIVDAYMIKSHDAASKLRMDMQKMIYRTTWDVLLVDETDTTATKQWRTAVTDGISRNVPIPSTPPTLEGRRFVLDYLLAIYVSGTWYRSDKEGDEFLEKNCGPNLLTVPSRIVEDKGMLARSMYNVVVCERKPGVDDSIDMLLERMTGTVNQRLRLLTPSKLRTVFDLVHFYSLFNQKIILFTKRKAHAALLTSIFKGCHAVDGSYKKGSAERERIAAEFCSYSLDFSNVLVTTSVFSIGKDMRPCQVVIQCCAVGESCRQLRQRTARNHRLDPLVSRDADTPKLCTSFDLLDPGENEWVSGLLDGATDGIVGSDHSVYSQDRYQLIIEDGFKDRIRVVSSSSLSECLKKEQGVHFPNASFVVNPLNNKMFVDYALFVLTIMNQSPVARAPLRTTRRAGWPCRPQTTQSSKSRPAATQGNHREY
ncbi:helicase-related protein, partial [bacterium]|nr:helicase-related protein [bacterium]